MYKRQALPVGVEIANPLDLRDDASSEHYQRAVNVLLNSQDYDALLVIHSPSAAAPGTESALALIDALKHLSLIHICLPGSVYSILASSRPIGKTIVV